MAAAKLEVITRFVEQYPDDPLAKDTVLDLEGMDDPTNPKSRWQRIESAVLLGTIEPRFIKALNRRYTEIAKRLAELGEPTAFANLHQDQASKNETA